MLYEWNEKWKPVPIKECDLAKEIAGCIWLDQLEEHCERLNISKKTLEMCLSNSLLYRKGLQSLEDYSFSIIPVMNHDNVLEERDKIGLLVSKKMCLVIIISDAFHRIDKFFTELIGRKWEKGQIAKLVYTFLDELLEMDAIILENMDFRIARMEEKLLKERPPKAFHDEIFSMKRQLLLLRSYYEQLLEVGERLYGNDNHVLAEKEREQFQIFTDRVKRFRDNVVFLKESLVEVREAYDSYLDLNMNATMKFLTVSTSVFMPLTLMTGWYGMNFKFMPELGLRWAYPVFAIVAVCLFILIIVYFKKKKYL